ncbi:MAG TPA: hypothetical protein PLK34_02105 [Candidatus Pacearchaeota archaeon]|nr:hypothetical protein [Candidatus Pacearchaeota archaeon]
MKKLVIFLIILSVIFNIFALGYPYFFQESGFPVIVGKSLIGTVSLLIQGERFNILIHSPENITYNFTNLSEPFTIPLNVSSDKPVESWWYTLNDITHSAVVEENISFTPNSSFDAVRGWNRLDVFANNSIGVIESQNVSFFVNVPNTAPVLSYIPDEMLACEGRSNFSYEFNATDLDETPLDFSLNPSDPFYVLPTDWTDGGEFLVEARIVSDLLAKSDVGIHPVEIGVTDGNLSDSKEISIDVIEVNNAPSVANIGARTIWTSGDNHTFAYQVRVLDIEEGTQTEGDFTYNLTFLTGIPFFSISDTGFISVTPNESNIGVYSLRVCVTDNGIDDLHENISYCGTGLPLTTCRDFSLTVTNTNRAPVITSFSPTELQFGMMGTQRTEFSVTKYDPDWTIPDSYWFVNGVLVQYVLGTNSTDGFSYVPGCGVFGLKTIKVEITDGLLNSSMEWNVSVENVPCQAVGGGGGGGGGGACVEKWACGEWSTCQELNYSFEFGGNVSATDFLSISQQCSQLGFAIENCGFQIRECIDLNNCTNKVFKKLSPPRVNACYLTANPNCFDGIKNCHNNGCEILTDCGGPCPACPSCSDGIQNQGEDGIDCGGPCPTLCSPEIPIRRIPLWWYLVVLIILTLIVIIIIKLRNVIKMLKEVK